jgi:hypothetical protein
MKMCVMCLEKLAENYSDYCKECQEIVDEKIHKEVE